MTATVFETYAPIAVMVLLIVAGYFVTRTRSNKKAKKKQIDK
jgi:hypothetical protein